MIFSIIIPLYNKEKSIGRTIESVLSQKLKNFELIIINDGSTDSSLECAKKYNDKRIRIITQKNQGVSAARNCGIQHAKYSWVAFLDADDMWLSDHLTELKKIIIKIPDADMIATQSYETKKNIKLPNKKLHTKKITNIDYFFWASKEIGIIHTSSVCIRKKILENINGFNTNYKRGEDLELWAKIALNHKVAISRKITSIYFRDQVGAMSTGILSNDGQTEINNLTLKDISPSSYFLKNEIEKNIFSQKKTKSIIIYINSRISSHIRGCILRNELEKAKKISDFFISPMNIKSHIYKKITFLPKSTLNTFWIIRELLKNLYYKIMI